MTVLMGVCFAAAIGFWCGYFYWAYQMIKGRKSGVRVFDAALLGNPFNLCFRPSLLTADGLRARKWFFVCMVGFPVSILLALLLVGAFRGS